MSGELTDSGPERAAGRGTAQGIHGSLGIGPRSARAAAAAVLVLAAQAVFAAEPDATPIGFSPFATLGYQYDTNVFMRPSGSVLFVGQGSTGLSDSIVSYQGGFSETAGAGPQHLSLEADATRDQYDRFSYLNHFDYNFGGLLDWRLGPVVDGTATYRQSRFMADFFNTFSTALLVDTAKNGSVTVRVLITPEWRLDLTPGMQELDTPLVAYPDFRTFDKIGIAGLNYLGFGKLTAGLQFTYDDGRYEGIAAATRYQQREADLTANYKVSGLSTFVASAGYTRRSSEPNPADAVPVSGGGGLIGYGSLGETSSATGSVSYNRKLTGKTSVSLTLFRRVDSYSAGANPEVGTGGSVGASWNADPKIIVNLNYGLTREQVQGGLVVVNAPNLSQRQQNAQFEVRYKLLTWLTVRPYVSWTRQTSTFTLANYSATIVGIDVTARPPP